MWWVGGTIGDETAWGLVKALDGLNAGVEQPVQRVLDSPSISSQCFWRRGSFEKIPGIRVIPFLAL